MLRHFNDQLLTQNCQWLEVLFVICFLYIVRDIFHSPWVYVIICLSVRPLFYLSQTQSGSLSLRISKSLCHFSVTLFMFIFPSHVSAFSYTPSLYLSCLSLSPSHPSLPPHFSLSYTQFWLDQWPGNKTSLCPGAAKMAAMELPK